jgi:hypothetical protein
LVKVPWTHRTCSALWPVLLLLALVLWHLPCPLHRLLACHPSWVVSN